MRRTLGLVAAAGVLGACGSPATAPAEHDHGAAEPAVSPELTVDPAGTVVPVGTSPEGLAIGTSGTAVLSTREPDAISLVDVAEDGTAAQVRQRVVTASAGRHVDLAGPDGPALVPLEGSNEVLEVALADGDVVSTATDVGSFPHNAARTADGTVVVTNEQGGGVVFLADGAVVATLPAGPPQPGGLAAVGRYGVVADVQGDGLHVYDATTRTEVDQQPLGVGLTHVLALAPAGSTGGSGPTDGVVAVADTVGGAVLLERITPDVVDLARIDAPAQPYGLAYDADRQRLYVTLTGSNLLRVVDVSDPSAPRVLGDVPTVRQPYSVAVDPRTGTVLVTGTADGVLQLVPLALLP